MIRRSANPVDPFLERQGVMVLDGGLATELEARGFDLQSDLWSARLLMDEPGAIENVHRSYLEAGADCIISGSYQATFPGFERWGISRSEATSLIQRAVGIAVHARDLFWRNGPHQFDRLRPLVAASVGPYAAYLADGSEYTDQYDIGVDDLYDFHRDRWDVLSATAPDLLACETIPSKSEADALLRLTREASDRHVWLSFCCKDGGHLSDGTSLADVLMPFDELDQVVALGVNCTAPQYISELVDVARAVTQKPIVVYPNSGERWDAGEKRWLGISSSADFGDASLEWRRRGASIIGGCCRTGPEHVRQLRNRLVNTSVEGG